MDKLHQEILARIGSRYPLEPLPVPEEVREIKRPLGLLTLNMYNWRAPKLRKVSVMRGSVRVPELEIFAIEAYPEDGYDLPLLAIDFSQMKKKTFVYINFIPLFTDPAYRDRYIAPLKPLHARYTIVPEKEPRPWMTPYITRYTIYAMPENHLLTQATACAFDYLAQYLDLLDSAKPLATEPERQRAREASRAYCDQLSEKDGSRKMLGRLIGMKRANTIFREVIR